MRPSRDVMWLVGTVVGVALVVAWMGPAPAPIADASEPPVQSRVTSSSPQSAGGYYPWPLSFPKMCGGIIMLEEGTDGRLKLSREQARRMLPVLHVLGASWQEIHWIERHAETCMSDRQAAFICAHKPEYEQTSFADRMPRARDSLTNSTLNAAATVLRQRLRGGVRHRPATASSRPRERMTLFDLCSGIWDMDSDPDLACDSSQARALLPLVTHAKACDRQVKKCEADMRGVLTEEQVDCMYRHMPELTDAKRRAFDRPDRGPYDDPLVWTTIELVAHRAGKSPITPLWNDF